MTEFQQEEIETFKEYLRKRGQHLIQLAHIQLLCGFIFHCTLISIFPIFNHTRNTF